jgi:methyl-accepting chemotaxis protein
MSALKAIGNFPLRWQMLLAPALLVLAILVIEGVNYRQQAQNLAVSERLYGESVRRARDLAEVETFALDINGRMFRAMTLAQSGAPEKILHGVADTMPADIDTLGARLAETASVAEGAGHGTEAARIRELTTKYQKAGASFAKFLFIDPTVGVSFATTAGNSFQELDTLLRSLASAYGKAASTDYEAARAAGATALRVELLMGFIAVIAGIAMSLWLSRTISAPLGELSEVAGALAHADWRAQVPHVERRDEVGAVARSVAVFRENGIENERLKRLEEEARREAQRQRETEAERHLSEQRRMQRDAEHAVRLAEMTQRFDSTAHDVLARFADAFGSLQDTAGAMSAAADATKDRVEDVSQAAVEASGNVQTIAASIEEMRGSIDQIARQVSSSSTLAGAVTRNAEQLSETLQAMSGAATEIGSVLDFIKSVASRTSLLALNATIEAARAGVAGRGFAVVAAEVKALATQTTEATDGVSRKVERIQTLSGETVAAVGAITSAIQEFSAGSSAISDAVSQQNASMQEIAATVESAATFTRQVSDQVQMVKGTAGDTELAAAKVLEASAELAHQSQVLEGEVSGFLEAMRPRAAA